MCRYLTLMAIFMVLSLPALRWPRTGGLLYILFGFLYSYWIFSTRQILSAAVILSWLPVTLPIVFLGILYWYGRPTPLRRAYQINIALPLLVVLIFGTEPVIRISGRLGDGNREARLIEGNSVKLIWAPEGPGWENPSPNDPTWLEEWSGPTWEEAQQVCQYLTKNGKSLADTPQNIWRLPTVEEAVRSMARHGKNCNGVWDSTISRASYAIKPDKESPLWNTHSPIIYWWTATEKDEEKAYVIVYNGKIIPRLKNKKMGSQGFRAVKEPGNR